MSSSFKENGLPFHGTWSVFIYKPDWHVYEEEEVEDLEDARNSMEAFGLL
jgi:hypothetical protein